MGRRIPWLSLIYSLVGGGVILTAYLLHFATPLLQLAVGVTLPWSLGYGLFVWSAIHGLEHELAFYLVACLGMNAGLLAWLERRWRWRRAASCPGKKPPT